MSTPSKIIPQHNIRIVPQEQQHTFQAEMHRRIAERAYQLFLEHGGNEGDDVSDWYQAELEILQRVPEVRETGAWCTANAALGESDAEAIEVMVSGSHAIVSGVRSSTGQTKAYLLVKWPVHIDPATAAAYVKGGTLTLTAKHCTAPPTTHVDNPPLAKMAAAASRGSSENAATRAKTSK